MDSKEQELSNWLNAIAVDIKSNKCQDGILQHLLKHCGEPVGEGEPCTDLNEWMASLLNLVDIAKRVFDLNPTTEDRLDRLQKKFEKEGLERGYTPNPTLSKWNYKEEMEAWEALDQETKDRLQDGRWEM